jgi:hypothetical protein
MRDKNFRNKNHGVFRALVRGDLSIDAVKNNDTEASIIPYFDFWPEQVLDNLIESNPHHRDVWVTQTTLKEPVFQEIVPETTYKDLLECPMEPVVYCASQVYETVDGFVTYLSVRHGDLYSLIQRMNNGHLKHRCRLQGFYGFDGSVCRHLTRQEAFDIAMGNGQTTKDKLTGNYGTLYSECIY